MTEDPSLLSEADSEGRDAFECCSAVWDCISTQNAAPVFSCVVRPGDEAWFQLCSGAKGSTGAGAGWTNSHGTFAGENLRATELLKLGYMGGMCNDIPTNRAGAPRLHQVALRWGAMHGA